MEKNTIIRLLQVALMEESSITAKKVKTTNTLYSSIKTKKAHPSKRLQKRLEEYFGLPFDVLVSKIPDEMFDKIKQMLVD